LSTDIEGFSTTSEKLEPQALISALNEYFSALCEVIDRHGGVITQFEGDAMLISFNTVKFRPRPRRQRCWDRYRYSRRRRRAHLRRSRHDDALRTFNG
jgi:class 3 adenylate cyclase